MSVAMTAYHFIRLNERMRHPRVSSFIFFHLFRLLSKTRIDFLISVLVVGTKKTPDIGLFNCL